MRRAHGLGPHVGIAPRDRRVFANGNPGLDDKGKIPLLQLGDGLRVVCRRGDVVVHVWPALVLGLCVDDDGLTMFVVTTKFVVGRIVVGRIVVTLGFADEEGVERRRLADLRGVDGKKREPLVASPGRLRSRHVPVPRAPHGAHAFFCTVLDQEGKSVPVVVGLVPRVAEPRDARARLGRSVDGLQANVRPLLRGHGGDGLGAAR
mmetsp:Transcript_5667/g.14609  ORF Transcript_5667/g.14609 Transcript_5667/m.14609 type:complete len:205 (-) Transcript_5667:457-1071(-)